MKLLRISDNCGHYLNEQGAYITIDKISKGDLLILASRALSEDDMELDEYDEDAIKNQAHQIIYKSIARKLQDLRERRQSFEDASARLFLKEYEKYQVPEESSR